MKLALKVGAGLLIVLALLVVGVLATLYLDAATPEHPVGFAEIAVKDPQDKPIQVDIWYPTNSPSGLSVIGLSAQRVATNGAVAGRSLPLVVVSHGNRGLASSHSDTALALASAGFVVAAVTHTGDNARDEAAPQLDARIIDVGGGESTLVDDLLARGYRELSVLDVSLTALEVAKARLGERTTEVHWLHGDVTTFGFARHKYDVWHSRCRRTP